MTFPTNHSNRHTTWLIIFMLCCLFASGCSGGNAAQIEDEEPLITDPGPEECQDAVIVEVFGDLNGNGVQDENEPLLSDVLVGMMAEGDAPDQALQYRTGERGRAYFPGFELTDCSPDGYSVLFLRQAAGYAFPEDPVVDLVGFNPNGDVVSFGLLPE